AYFKTAPPEDAAWALFFLSGRRIKRLIPSRALVDWALELSGVPEWLLGECFSSVGDLAEVCALLVGRRGESDALPLHRWIEERVLPLRDADPTEQRARLRVWAEELDRRELFVLAKILTGEFRVGVSQTLVVRAVGEAAGLDKKAVAHRMM